MVRIAAPARAENLEVFCRFCKLKIRVDIENGQSFESQSTTT